MFYKMFASGHTLFIKPQFLWYFRSEMHKISLISQNTPEHLQKCALPHFINIFFYSFFKLNSTPFLCENNNKFVIFTHVWARRKIFNNFHTVAERSDETRQGWNWMKTRIVRKPNKWLKKKKRDMKREKITDNFSRRRRRTYLKAADQSWFENIFFWKMNKWIGLNKTKKIKSKIQAVWCIIYLRVYFEQNLVRKYGMPRNNGNC